MARWCATDRRIRISLCGVVAVYFALLWPSTAVHTQDVASPLEPALRKQVDEAVERAKSFLLAGLAKQDDSHAALASVALLKAGVPKNAPEIQAVCERLTKRVVSKVYTPHMHHVYEGAVTLLCLANANPVKYRGQIHAIADYLVASQGKFGQWHYPYSADGDTSISQYAMLGLWEAARAGYPVPIEVWDKSADWHLKTQLRDGGFTYHPTMTGGGSPLHSMTVAGIGSLRISRRYLFTYARTHTILENRDGNAPRRHASGKRFGVLEPFIRADVAEGEAGTEFDPREPTKSSYKPQVQLTELDAGVDRAVTWMTTNFTVERPTGYPIYFLYGLERASALAELRTYGTHDWYREGAIHLLRTQSRVGSWTDNSGEQSGTAFGLLFLVRATSKMVGPQIPRVEFGSGTLVGGRGLPADLKEAANPSAPGKAGPQASLETLLNQLHAAPAAAIDITQQQIVEKIVISDRRELIGQLDRLKDLVRHPDPEVRRVAYWALGRSGDMGLAPVILEGLQDPEVDVFIEARNALRCLSRDISDISSHEQPLDAASRAREVQKWKDWYRQMKPYTERDRLGEGK